MDSVSGAIKAARTILLKMELLKISYVHFSIFSKYSANSKSQSTYNKMMDNTITYNHNTKNSNLLQLKHI